ncbi:M20/M25/M40 family metallo-hydrolase [Sandaracinus amylolyticus]|uniref:Peptidase M20 n=1 Tax=Sandaracinus amylolyticus TaxID=927083 RepID=A0A0F6W7M3_9BACT|nr:M20/M25/M40 family metallo-hydrolase [Sandaracinus amylolyticus]AKF09568.1 peptidase M20 [Sandaracinus amylolyticus]
MSPNPPLDWTAITAEAIEHFKALLRIPTVNPPGNERPAADYLARIFEAEGIEHTIVESEPTRASIVARIRAKNPSGKGPLLLNGHLDVVGVDREKWTHDPFGAVEADGCIWGRGAIDMKNMVTMSAMTLVLLKRARVALDRDIIFAGVADEESGSNKGAVFLVEKHRELVQSEYVLNEVGGHTLHMGAARYYPIQVAEKGICWFEITAEGEPGHGSMPHPGNAVVRIARAIAALGDSRLPQHASPVVENFLRTIAKGAPFPQSKVLPLLLNPRLASTLLEIVQRIEPDRAKGLNAMLRNTASPTMLDAGHKVNVIPSRASAHVDGRVLPGMTEREFLDEVQRVIGPGLRITVREQHDGVEFTTDTPLYRAIESTLAVHDPGGVPVPYMIPGFTDSFAYARLGAICYGFSPVRLGRELEFTKMYHGHDERIPVEGFAWGLRVLYELVRDFCARS